jgi:1-pyrroline-5-carboxylate dehydrogenase
MGTPRNFENFVNAVIDEAAFDNIVSYIEKARSTPDAEIVYGGTYDKSQGYFIKPTVIQAKDPRFVTMVEEVRRTVCVVGVGVVVGASGGGTCKSLAQRGTLVSDVVQIFGPVLSVYVYEDAAWEATLELVDTTSPYALTGAIFSQDRCGFGFIAIRPYFFVLWFPLPSLPSF